MKYTYRTGVIVPFVQKFYKQLILAVAGLFVASLASMTYMAGAATESQTLYGADATLSGAIATEIDQYVGDGSWQNDSSKSKFSLPIDVVSALGSFTIADIDSLEFVTKRLPADTTGYDFYATIYTVADDTDDDAAWYGRRITIDPIYSTEYDDASNDWVVWNTDESSDHTPTVYDSNHAPFGWYDSGANTTATLEDLQAGPVNWSTYIAAGGENSSIDYRDEAVLYIAFETGSAWNDEFAGLIDGLQLTLNNGSVLTVDLELDEPPYPRTAEITSPMDGATVSGVVDFNAYLDDDDADAIQWAVREGTCAAGTNTVFGNVDGHSDSATIDQTDLSNQTFAFSADMSGLADGMYCFIYNPVEDSGEAGIRLTSEFTLDNPQVLGSKDECKNGGWNGATAAGYEGTFKNQGHCVSHFASNGTSTNARNKNN